MTNPAIAQSCPDCGRPKAVAFNSDPVKTCHKRDPIHHDARQAAIAKGDCAAHAASTRAPMADADDVVTLSKATFSRVMHALEAIDGCDALWPIVGKDARSLDDKEQDGARVESALAEVEAVLQLLRQDAALQSRAAPTDASNEAHLQIQMGLVERLLDDPNYETSSMEMEHWGPVHGRLQVALKSALSASAPTQPVTQE